MGTICIFKILCVTYQLSEFLFEISANITILSVGRQTLRCPHNDQCLLAFTLVLTQSAIRKYHRLDSSFNKNLFSQSYRGWKSEIRVTHQFGFYGGLSSWFADGYLLTPSSHGLSSVCVRRKSELFGASSYKDSSPYQMRALPL